MFFKRTKNQKGEGWFESIISLIAIIGFLTILGPKFCSISMDTDSKGIVIETKEAIVEEVKKPDSPKQQKEAIVEEVKKPDPPRQQKGEFKKL